MGKKITLRRKVWLETLYFNIYIYINVYYFLNVYVYLFEIIVSEYLKWS